MTEKIQALLEPLLEGTDMFMISIKIKPVNNIKIFLDADNGLAIEKCAGINRRLSNYIEDAAMFPNGDFSLEVSSPGIDEPLVQLRQYKKNVGRKVTVTDKEDLETTGMMTEVTDEGITLEVKVLKQKEPAIKQIPFLNIKKTIVQIIF